jgi:hypothetical protein
MLKDIHACDLCWVCEILTMYKILAPARSNLYDSVYYTQAQRCTSKRMRPRILAIPKTLSLVAA